MYAGGMLDMERAVRANTAAKHVCRKISTVYILLLLLGSVSWRPAIAQMNTAEIWGTVADVTGARIPGAQIAVFSVATQEKLLTISDKEGRFELPQLPVGEYTLTANVEGFKEYRAEHIVLRINDHNEQPIMLQVGSSGETSVVQALVTGIQSTSPSIKDVIAEHEITKLPLKSRQILQLTLLSEGVVSPPGGTRGDSLQQTGSLINVLGQRTGHNLFLLNGTSITDEYYNNVVVNPSVDSVQQFILNKTSYEAEFGGKSGAVINVLTMSGTNDLHGSVFEFFRNGALDARNYFAMGSTPVPAYHQNQFGGTIGGPIARTRFFYFANYEGLRLHQDLAHIFTVPTAQQRLGQLGSANVTGPFDSSAVGLLSPAFTPLPNLVGNSNNLLTESPLIQNNDQYSTKVDGALTPNDYAFVFGIFFDAQEHDPYGSAVLNEAQLPAFGRLLRTHTIDVTAGESHTFSSGIMNDFRFGWLRVSGGQQDPSAGNPFASVNGIQGTTANPVDQGFPQFNLSGQFTTIGSPTGVISRVDNHFDFFDNVIAQRKSHHVRFGAYMFHLNFQPRNPNNARGVFTYTGAYTGSPLGDFLKGQPASAQVGLGDGSETASTDWLHLYLQDRWAIRRNLTMNIGVRYEYNRNLSAGSNQTSNIDLNASGGPTFVAAGNPAALPAAAAFNATLSPIPILAADHVGWDPSLLTPRRVRLSPRIGIVWQLPREIVLRGSYGVYTNQASYSILQNLAGNMPFFFTETVTAPATSNTAYSTSSILSSANYKVPGSISANGVDHTFRVEYNQVWTFAAEEALPGNTVLDLEYVGSRTVHADSATTVNMPQLPPPGTTSSVASRRPYPQLSAFTAIRWNGWAKFNSFTAKASRPFSRGLYFQGSYTYSKSLDDASDAGTTNAEFNLPQNMYAPQLEAAPSSFNHRNRVSASATYDLPFAAGATGWMKKALGNWRMNGIFSVQSGAPFTVNLSTSAGNEPANVGLVNASTNVERPNVTGNPNRGQHTAAQWFDIAAFSLPAAYTFGNAQRNMTLGPRYVDLDLSLQKDFTVAREDKVEFHFDVFNALNHPNFNLPGRIANFNSGSAQTSPTFGAITSAQDPRDLQFGLKFLF
jgi:Carboxypeptidase regulatory-like domain